MGDQRDTILIVDDDEFNRELLGEFLDILGYASVSASNGHEALDRLSPDISAVLLDVMMPHLDGFEVTRRIRLHNTCSDIPIILVTALTNLENKLQGVEAGANDFISKPIDLTELRIRLNAQIKMRHATLALAAVHDQELAIAAEIQSTFLQGLPPVNIPGVSIAAFTKSSAKIDGDFYHFFAYNGRHLDIAVGDVMGKGIQAAVLGAAVKSAIQKAISRSLVLSMGELPCVEDIVRRIHRDMTPHLIQLETFVTLAYMRVDLDLKCLSLVDCGHTGLINYRLRDSHCGVLHGDNLPLGVVAHETHSATVVPFESGDIFVLYSDGITESENSEGEFFGELRLAAIVKEKHACGTEGILQAIRSAVLDFTGTSPMADDQTCVVLKIDES